MSTYAEPITIPPAGNVEEDRMLTRGIDICRTWSLGADSFMNKPVLFQSLVGVMRGIDRYWIEIVELPREMR
jgi:hypothetical protein